MSASHTILHLTIQAPAAIVWQGEVRSVESENREGTFTILPDHANFMTPLNEADVTVTFADGTKTVYTYEHAVLFLKDNQITLYVHEAAEVKHMQ